jgi:rhamnogalacturonyl hydrolase YesR
VYRTKLPVVILALLIVGVGGTLAYRGMPRAVSGLTIASKSVTFVEQSLNEETGYFYLTYVCDATSLRCSSKDDPNKPPHSGYATMSMKDVGIAAHNPSLSKKADTVLDQVMQRCESDGRFCEWNFFPLHLYYQATGEQRYLDSMLSVTDDIMRERPLKELIDANIPVKWWRLYEATGDVQYLDHLIAIADKELAANTAHTELGRLVYTASDAKFEVRSYDMPVMWALYVPAYLASGDKKYLDVVTTFFDKAQVETHTNHFWGVTETGNLIKGLEAMLIVADASPAHHDQYREKTRKALEVILRDRWDTPENPRFNGDYGFLVANDTKATNIQGWIIRLFMTLKDETFSI